MERTGRSTRASRATGALRSRVALTAEGAVVSLNNVMEYTSLSPEARRLLYGTYGNSHKHDNTPLTLDEVCVDEGDDTPL